MLSPTEGVFSTLWKAHIPKEIWCDWFLWHWLHRQFRIIQCRGFQGLFLGHYCEYDVVYVFACLRRCVNIMTAAEWGARTTGGVLPWPSQAGLWWRWRGFTAMADPSVSDLYLEKLQGHLILCSWFLYPSLDLVLTLCWTNYSESERKLLSWGRYLRWFLFRDDFGSSMIHCFHPFKPPPPRFSCSCCLVGS